MASTKDMILIESDFDDDFEQPVRHKRSVSVCEATTIQGEAMSERKQPKRRDTKIVVTIQQAVKTGDWIKLTYQAEYLQCPEPLCCWHGDRRNFLRHCKAKHKSSVKALNARLPDRFKKSYKVTCPWGCKKQLEEKSLEVHHKSAHPDEPPFTQKAGEERPRAGTCPICRRQVLDVSTHLFKKHQNEDGDVPCNLCGKAFSTAEVLRQHVTGGRCGQSSSVVEECEHCGRPINNCKSKEGREVHISGACMDRSNRRDFITAVLASFDGNYQLAREHIVSSAEQTILKVGREDLGHGCSGPKIESGFVKSQGIAGYRQVKIHGPKPSQWIYWGAHEITALKTANADQLEEWMLSYTDEQGPAKRLSDAEHLCHTTGCDQHCTLVTRKDNLARLCNVLGPVHRSCNCAGSADDEELPCRFVHPNTEPCHLAATVAHFQAHQKRIRDWKNFCQNPSDEKLSQWFLADAAELNSRTEPGNEYVMQNLAEMKETVKKLQARTVKTSHEAVFYAEPIRRPELHFKSAGGSIQQGAERTVALVSRSRPQFPTSHLSRLAASHRCHNPLCLNSSHIQLEPAWLNTSREACVHKNQQLLQCGECEGHVEIHCPHESVGACILTSKDCLVKRDRK